MSYILDALKRADAERERGHVPGLHSQGTPAPAAGAARSRRIGLPMMAAAVAVLLAVAAALWWWRSAPGETPAPGAAMPPPQTSVTAPPAAVVDIAPASSAPPLPILAPAPVQASPPAIAKKNEPIAPAAGTPGPPPAPSSNAVRNLTELPAEAQAQLPKVTVSGSTYSSNPAHRMLIVNGNIMREGQTVSPGLVLEVITPRSAVFNYNGTRFNVNF